MTPAERKLRQIEIVKVTEGLWRPRTYYDLTVEGDYVGRYPTIRECDRIAEYHLASNAEYWKSLGEDFQ